MMAGHRIVRIWLVDGIAVAESEHSELDVHMVELAEHAVDSIGPVPALAAVDLVAHNPDEAQVVVAPDLPDAGPVTEAVAASRTATGSSPRWSELDTSTLTLLGTRLRSRGDLDSVRFAVTMLLSDRPSDVDRLVPEFLARDLLRSRGSACRLSLTPRGNEELASAMALATNAVGRPAIEAAYHDFIPVNREFLSTVSSWQSRRAGHSAGGSVDEFSELVARIEPVIGRLSSLMPRFAGYQPRFIRALGRAVDRSPWVDSPGLDSVHTVWFEFHEHLLATLGRSRTQER